MPAGRYLIIPFLRTDEKSKALNEIRASEKLHKKTDKTNILATNFVWEQLIIIINKLCVDSNITILNCFFFSPGLKYRVIGFKTNEIFKILLKRTVNL